ncbi:MAG: DinB family protein [Methylococcales bacterium]|nr:DinB family protein [Methylococcales bacterium]
MIDSIKVWKEIRRLIIKSATHLSEEQWLAQPAGFANNIAWNIGHILVAQQGLIYRQCGLEMRITRQMGGMYAPGTSPAGWEAAPDIPDLIARLESQVVQMEADVNAGIFQTYTPYTTSTSFQLDNVIQAISFNNFHEGLHLGVISALYDQTK